MREEADRIRAALLAELPTTWDGKTCIEEMRAGDALHWRQMEWIGWYFEWRAGAILTARLGGGVGPRYATTGFDYRNDAVWDFESHVNNAGKPWAILDDTPRSFKTWHDELKGDPSKYVLRGRTEGRSSRRRKTVFHFAKLIMFRLDATLLRDGQEQGWLKGFQQGMRNSNTLPRPRKLQVHLGKLPQEIRL